MEKFFWILAWFGLFVLYLSFGFIVWIVSSTFEKFFDITNNKYMDVITHFQNTNENFGFLSIFYMILFWPLHLLLGFVFKFIK